MAGIKKNFFYNLILTVGNYLFPLLTYPYVSRVLGVDKIGTCSYIDSVINYFVLFAALGVGSLGVREIAKVKQDRKKLNEVFSSLTIFNIALTLLAIILLCILIYYFSYFQQYKPYLLVGISKLIMSAFLVDWLYQGLAEFRYVTIISLICKTLFMISVFIFVHDEDDAVIYYMLICLMVVSNAIINWVHSYKFVSFSYRYSHLSLYILPILSYGLYRILTSMYTSFNVAYLGTVTNTVEVGNFSTATKLYSVLMSVFSAFTTVMVPKVCELLSKGENENLKIISMKTFDVVFAFSVPMIVFCSCYAPIIIKIIAGEGYSGAILPFRIIMVLLVIIGLEQIIVQQFLMALKNTKYIVYLSLIGAFVGICANILLVKSLQSVGSAIAWSISEITILIISSFIFRKKFGFAVPYPKLLKFVFAYIPFFVVYYLFKPDDSLNNLFIGIIVFVIWFYIVNSKIVKVDTIINIKNIFVDKVNKYINFI